ncbi:hypothetical protein [Cystobacter fuscus]|uniref:CdiA C-terminal domain-containing protein n=1 Tax=Cystobacter fuscus TaxID=43 RepID=UPI0037BF511A
MSKADQKKYPRFAYYVRFELPEVTLPATLVNAMKKMGASRKNQLKTALQWDFGPEIRIVPLVGGAPGVLAPDSESDEIRINESVVKDFEAGYGSRVAKEGNAYLVGVMLLHELTRRGDDSGGVERPGAEGEDFQAGMYESAIFDVPGLSHDQKEPSDTKPGQEPVERVSSPAQSTHSGTVNPPVDANGHTRPSRPPDPNAKPGGRRTPIPSDADKVTETSLKIENESADILARQGYEVEQNPKVPGSRNPDYKIEGRIFDNYAPSTSRPRNIWSEVDGNKVNPNPPKTRQADRIVINLRDSDVDIAALQGQFKDWVMPNLKEVLVITKDGKVLPFWP